MAGKDTEKKPLNLKEQIDALAPFGISNRYQAEVDRLRKRILEGETTGDHISDYAYLFYYDKEERDKIIEQVREFEKRIGAHVGEEIIFYYPKVGLDDQTTHLYGIIGDSQLEAKRDKTVLDRRVMNLMHNQPEEKDLDQGESLIFDWGRLELFVPTKGIHLSRRGGGRFEYYGDGKSGLSKPKTSIVQEDIEYHPFSERWEIFVGRDEIEKWKKEKGNKEIYQELVQAKDSLSTAQPVL